MAPTLRWTLALLASLVLCGAVSGTSAPDPQPAAAETAYFATACVTFPDNPCMFGTVSGGADGYSIRGRLLITCDTVLDLCWCWSEFDADAFCFGT